MVAERLRHTGAAVVGRAPSDADDEMARAGIVRVLQQLADAVGGGDPRIPFVLRHEREARRLGHFDHRGRSPVDQPVLGVDGIAQRPANSERASIALRRRHQRVDRAVTTVRNRDQHQVCIRHGVADPLADRGRRLEGGQ